jgi:hypothetical protein
MTLVLFRRRALGELSGSEQKIGARVRKSRQKEAAGAVDAVLMQIEWRGEGLQLRGVGTEVEEGVHERVRARIICEPRTKGSVFPSWLLMRRRRLRSDHCPAPWWGNRGSFFQCRPNLAALLSAQRRELESVLCSQCTNNFCRDHLFVAVRQRDFDRYGLAQYESFSNECPQTTFAEITQPALQAKFLAVPLETNPNPRLEHVPG